MVTPLTKSAHQFPPRPVVAPAHTGRDHQDPALVHWEETTVPGGMVVASALGSALLYAVAAVTQQRAASAQPLEYSLRLALLFNLLRRPLWLVGLACDIGAFLLQFWALDHGGLVLVQPLLVSGLLFALPLGALISKERTWPRR